MTPTQVAHIMPPLPAPVDTVELYRRVADVYTAEQMHEYARAAVEAALRDAPQQVEPLTDEQIWASDEIMGANGTVTQLPMDELRAVVRAVEAAHGITERPSAPTAVEPAQMTEREAFDLLADSYMHSFGMKNSPVRERVWAAMLEARAVRQLTADENNVMRAAQWDGAGIVAPGKLEPARNCRHCGGPDDVICAGQCRASKGTI